jgi:uncharacterized iron-regulated membrane protein
MARTLNGKLRKLWLDIHLWIGLGLLVAIVPISATGAALVWHDPLDRLLHPARFDVSKAAPALAPSAYLGAARTAFDGRAVPTAVRMPAEAGMPVTVQGRVPGPVPQGARPKTLTAFLDPADARVTDVENTSSSLISIMHRLHGSLMIPEIGRKVVGWIGWAMTISCITGLIIWWPRNGAFAKALRWRRTPVVMDNLHHMIGFWICLPLAVLSLTGVYISFPQTSRAVFGVEQKGPAPKQAQRGRVQAAPLASPASGIDAENPGARISAITLPTEGERPSWRVQFAPAAEGAPAAAIEVADGSLKAKMDRGGAGGRGAQDSLSRLMRTIHDGQQTPFIWQLIVFLGGVAPVVLAITGLVMWVRKQFRKARLRRPELQPAE